MLNKVARSAKKFTVGDVYKEAAKMLKKEVKDLKGGILPFEEIKMDELAKALSKIVLQEMKIG